MTIFDQHEQGFETKFVHEEVRFKAIAGCRGIGRRLSSA
jgi:hypothetical protein